MNNYSTTKFYNAVAYCRVSSEKQVKEGNGLDSQETNINRYAEREGYGLLKVFKEKGVSGKDEDRPALNAMYQFLDANPNTTVIFDTIDRLARDNPVHWKIKEEIKRRNCKIAFVQFDFEDSALGRYMENNMASNSQLFRELNQERVIANTRARMLAGYDTRKPPLGYTLCKDSKLYVIDDSISGIIKECLEGYAYGKFRSQAEILTFLKKSPEIRELYKGIENQKNVPKRILERSATYAGYIHLIRTEKVEWGIDMVKALHEPIISLDTHEMILDRLNGKESYRPQQSHCEDFPLRGYLRCSCCKGTITASNTVKKTKKHPDGKLHPYYRCLSSPKKCKFGGKSIKKENIELCFQEEILSNIKPSKQVINLARELMKDKHEEKVGGILKDQTGIKRDITKIDSEISALVDKIVSTKNSSVQSAFENKIDELSLKKEGLEKEVKSIDSIDFSVGTSLDTLDNFMYNIDNKWKNCSFSQKQSIMNIVFGSQLEYDRENGFGTISKRLPFRLLEGGDTLDVRM